MAFYSFNIGKPRGRRKDMPTWWRYNVDEDVITAGFDAETGDRGDKILNELQTGDWVLAYANSYGYVGAGQVLDEDTYFLHDEPPSILSDHQHERGVRWLYVVPNLSDAVSPALVGVHAPRNTREHLANPVGEELLSRIQAAARPEAFPKRRGKDTQYEHVYEAVAQAGALTSIREVESWLKQHYPNDTAEHARDHACLLCVNDANRRHKDKGRQDFRSDRGNPKDLLFRVGRHQHVRYEVYDRIRHGIWDVVEDEDGGWHAVLLVKPSEVGTAGHRMVVDWTAHGFGEWTQTVAPHVLPILIKHARQGDTLSYTQLSNELAEAGLEPKARKTLYGKPVGLVGYVLRELGIRWGVRLPPINALVVGQATGLPGSGADEFVHYFFQRQPAANFLMADRKAMMEEAIEAVKNYGDKWLTVAEALDTPILPLDTGTTDSGQALALPPLPSGYSEESKEHKALKKWVSQHPSFFMQFGHFGPGQTEIQIRSGDRLDVHFENGHQRLAVEVKPSHASPAEFIRGIFQVVKYRAILRAEQQVKSAIPNASAVLVTVKRPDSLAYDLMKRLNVEHVQVPPEAEIDEK